MSRDERSAQVQRAQRALNRFLDELEQLDLPADSEIPDGFERLDRTERQVLSLLWRRVDERQREADEAGDDGTGEAAEDAAPAHSDPDDGERAPRPAETRAPAPPAGNGAEDFWQIDPSGIPKLAEFDGVGAAETRAPERVNLRNGRAGADYSAEVAGYDGLTLRDDGGSGLELDAAGRVSGCVETAGDYRLVLTGTKAGQEVTVEASVTIIPNARDLWTSTPSDRDDPHWKPDADFATALGDGFIAAASKRGRSHAKAGGFRDDGFAIHARGTGQWHLIALADGAGSASHARLGSEVACQTALSNLPALLAQYADPVLIDSLKAYLDDPEEGSHNIRRKILYQALVRAGHHAAKAVSAKAEEIGEPVSALSTTLLLAAVRKVGPHWLIGTFSIGDGGIAVYDAAKGEVKVLSAPDAGAFAGQTRFLTEAEFADPQATLDRVFLDVRTDFTALAVMTDGISDPKFPTDRDLASTEAWKAFWDDDFGKDVQVAPGNPALKEQFLGWLDFWSKGNHDDRTLAVMVPATGRPQG